MEAMHGISRIRNECDVGAVSPCGGTTVLGRVEINRRQPAFLVCRRFPGRFRQAFKPENAQNFVVEATCAIRIVCAKCDVANDGHRNPL